MKCQDKYNVMGFQNLVCIFSQKLQQKLTYTVLLCRDARKILLPLARSVREEAAVCPAHSYQPWSSPFANKASHQNVLTNSVPCGFQANFHTISNFNHSVVHSVPKIDQTWEANSLFCYFQSLGPSDSWAVPSLCPSN